MNEKKRFYLALLLLILILLTFTKTTSALRVVPAKLEYNFEPGFQQTIEYSVYDNNPDKKFRVYTDGDLSEYTSLDKTELIGGGKFKVTLKLPNFIEVPGKHRILVGVAEIIEQDKYGNAAVGTSVVIQTVIDVYVPYPGRYLDLSLSTHDVNIGETMNLELGISSMGKEDVNVTPIIEIYSQDEKIDTMYLEDFYIKSQEKITIKRKLDTTNYQAGLHKAVAIVDYGKIAKVESQFRIGDLSIEIINHTNKIGIGGIKKFDIDIQSGWNDKIDGAYAEVFIFNNSLEMTSFETSSTNLEPWEKKTITGYFDTNNFIKGIYNASIVVNYYGRDVGKSSTKWVNVEFFEEPRDIKIFIIIGIILVCLIVLAIIKKFFIKNGKGK